LVRPVPVILRASMARTGDFSNCFQKATEFGQSVFKKKRRPAMEPPFQFVIKPGILSPDRQLHASAAENGNGAAVLRPAGDVVANGNRAFLAVGDRLHALSRNAARSEVVLGGSRTASAESEVVFARTAFVGMAFERDCVLRITAEPLSLTI